MAGDGLFISPKTARHHQCRRAEKKLDRLPVMPAQHHDHSARTTCSTASPFSNGREAVGRLENELNYNAMSASAASSNFIIPTPAHAMRGAATQRLHGGGGRMPRCSTSMACERCCVSRFRDGRFRSRRPVATGGGTALQMTWSGAMPARPTKRCRHHPEL